MSLNVYMIETPQLKGRRSRKGKKRSKEHKLNQTIHSTVNGLGRISILRRNNGKFKPS